MVQKGAFRLQMKPQCCLILLNLAWLDNNKFHGVCFIREYQSNVAETYYLGIEDYRKLRMVLTHSRLNRHVYQTRHTAIGKYSRLAHRQAK